MLLPFKLYADLVDASLVALYIICEEGVETLKLLGLPAFDFLLIGCRSLILRELSSVSLTETTTIITLTRGLSINCHKIDRRIHALLHLSLSSHSSTLCYVVIVPTTDA